VAALEAERRPTGSRDFRAAGAPAAVRRKDRDVVAQREHPITESVVSRPRKLLRELWPQQVNARDLSDEERTAREEVLRVVRAAQVRDEIGDVLGSVSRRRNTTDRELADVDDVAVRVRHMWIREFGVGAGMQRDRPKLRKRRRARDVVVVNVRLERIGDKHAEARSRAEIRVNVPVGVDEKRNAGLRVSDEVARVAQAGVEELLDQQLARTLARVLLRSRLLADRLGFLLQHLFTRTEVLRFRRDHGRDAFVDALALQLCLFE